MSNARYFADGTDFYRVIYNDGTTEGPYIRPSSARQVGRSSTRVQTRYDGSTYQYKKSFKLQKLEAISGVDSYFEPETYLEWVDVDA